MECATRLEVPESLSPATLAAFLADLEIADAPVVTLVGKRPGVFCAGLDLMSLLALTPRERDEMLGLAVRTLLLVATLPRPTVAVVTGRASGGGVGLAAACDVVIAEPSASFALPEALFGLEPAIITPLLTRRMSGAAVRRLALLGSAVPASEALRVGLVDEVTDGEPSTGHALARAERDLARANPDSVHTLKCERGSTDDLRLLLEAGRLRTADRLNDAAVAERIRRFAQEGVSPWTDTAPLEES